MPYSTARVILGQVLSIVMCGGQTHAEVTACDYMPNLPTIRSMKSKFYWTQLSYLTVVKIKLCIPCMIKAWLKMHDKRVISDTQLYFLYDLNEISFILSLSI